MLLKRKRKQFQWQWYKIHRIILLYQIVEKEPAQQHLFVFIYMLAETLWKIFMTWWCFILGFKCCTCDDRIRYYSGSCSFQKVPACVAYSTYVFVSKQKKKHLCLLFILMILSVFIFTVSFVYSVAIFSRFSL